MDGADGAHGRKRIPSDDVLPTVPNLSAARVEENYQSPFCATCNSEYWSAQVMERYPDSEWAILIENPDFADQEEVRREEERLAYEELLQRYYAKAYQEVLLVADEVINFQPTNNYLCKYRLLRAQSIGGLSGQTGGDRRAYFEALQLIVRECPDTEEAAFAQALLTALNGRPRDAEQAEETEEEEVVAWEHKPYLTHYFGMLVPVGRGNVEELRATIADFNSEFFASSELRVTANLINRNFQIVLVKDFKRADYSLDYYEVFTNNTDALEPSTLPGTLCLPFRPRTTSNSSKTRRRIATNAGSKRCTSKEVSDP